MTQPIILILNGAKGTGKDMIADSICDQYDAIHCRFKDPLYDICSSIAGVDRESFVAMATDRTTKEVPFDILGSRSPREYMIYVSEEVIKPSFGKDYFGYRAFLNIQQSLDCIDNVTPGKKHQFFIFSDGGFSKEVIPLVGAFGESAVKIVHLNRDNRDYGNDSRRSLYPNDFPQGRCPYFFTKVYNEEGNPQRAIDEVASLMHTCLADFNNSNERRTINED